MVNYLYIKESESATHTNKLCLWQLDAMHVCNYVRSSTLLIRQACVSRCDKVRRSTESNPHCTLTSTLALWRTSVVYARKMQKIHLNNFYWPVSLGSLPAFTIFPVAVWLLTSVAKVHSPNRVQFGIFYLTRVWDCLYLAWRAAR